MALSKPPVDIERDMRDEDDDFFHEPMETRIERLQNRYALGLPLFRDTDTPEETIELESVEVEEIETTIRQDSPPSASLQDYRSTTSVGSAHQELLVKAQMEDLIRRGIIQG